jgi:N-acetyltransferase 10
MSEPHEDVEPHDIAVRKRIPALLVPAHERANEAVDYIGVSFGLTTDLYNFWKRSHFEPVYVRQAPNDLTGEHSCIMINSLGLFDVKPLRAEFRRRFLRLLSHAFRNLPVDLALALCVDSDVYAPQWLAASSVSTSGQTFVDGIRQYHFQDFAAAFSIADLKRLKLAATTFVDTAVILDLVTCLAQIYFSHHCYRCPDGSEGVVLSHAQAAVLLGVGLQCKTTNELSTSTTFAGVPAQQLRAFFLKAVSRLVEHIKALQIAAKGETLSAAEADDALNVEKNEVVSERVGRGGEVVGITVRREERKKVSTDGSLFRDAKAVELAPALRTQKRART